MPCTDCHQVHPATPSRFSEWPTSYHTGFCVGVMGHWPATDFWLVDQGKAYTAGYEAGKRVEK